MREILFRGKRVDNGKWVYGYYIKAIYHWHNHGIHEDWIVTDTVQNGGWCNVRGKYSVVLETVGQYTGLTDKNGKKIFEGDILSSEWGYKGVAEFDEIMYAKCECLFNDDCETIGNIYDNAELLEANNEHSK